MSQNDVKTRTSSRGNIILFSGLSALAALFVASIMFIRMDVARKLMIGPIPSSKNLETATGILEPPIHVVGRRISWFIGSVRKADGSRIDFSCQPGNSDVDCLYSRPYENTKYIGRPISMKYMVMPNWLYPELTVGSKVVPRQHANIIMEATVKNGVCVTSLLSYSESVERLKSFR